MQEQVKFKLSSGLLSGINQDAVTLYEELQLNLKAIESLLVVYHFRSRGRVFNILIDKNSIEMLSDSMTKFVVIYAVGQFNACADLDYHENASMEILLDLDLQNQTGILTGEYIPEREPDEF